MTEKLAKQLKELRNLRGYSLRDVENKTKISNAYISQLERDEEKKPSPHILHKLAEMYEVPYELLMDAAGYITDSTNVSPGSNTKNQSSGKLSALGAALMSEKFTSEEEIMISAFIQAIRSGKNKNIK